MRHGAARRPVLDDSAPPAGVIQIRAAVSEPGRWDRAASGFALSADPEQRFLYMIDGANHHVWIL